MLHLKYHGIFIIMADEKINKGVHPPQKIMKKIKKITKRKIFIQLAGFFYFPNFFVSLHSNFYFLIGQTLFSTQKFTQFVLEQMVLVTLPIGSIFSNFTSLKKGDGGFKILQKEIGGIQI